MMGTDPEQTARQKNHNYGADQRTLPPRPMTTAVLFLVFNRPDTTRQVFEAISYAKPPRLYVAADGPREGRNGEAAKVRQVREIATAVDWPCRVETLFRKENLGCKYAVSSAISWFFQHEEQGIILEDDCLPHPSFFRYCEWGLEKFKEDHRVWHLNGNNFSARRSIYNCTVDFVSLAQVWGWATWSDRWAGYSANAWRVKDQADARCKTWNMSRVAKFNKQLHLAALQKGLDTWDYQWQVLVLNRAALALSPRSNLISNLGDGADATHTEIDTRLRLPVAKFSVPSDSDNPSFNSELNRWYEKKMQLRSFRGAAKWLYVSTLANAQERMKNLMRAMVFGNIDPIVVAGTGCSSSTMLTDAIAKALIDNYYGRYPLFLRRLLRKLAVQFVSRLENSGGHHSPILRTLDLYKDVSHTNPKFLFLIGDPMDSALSVRDMGEKHGQIWIEEHIYNLSGNGSPHELFHKDVLNYRNQIKAWATAKNTLVIHCDDLWDQTDVISRFLGFDVRLPGSRKPVQMNLPASYDEAMFNELRRIAANLLNGAAVKRTKGVGGSP